jgi:molecular chaperone GrpE
MTRKSKEKEKNKIESEKDDNSSNYHSNNAVNEPEAKVDKTEDKTDTQAKTEVKRIEGEEPQKLEYFSKDELAKRTKELEEKLQQKEESLKLLNKQADDWKNKYMRLQAEFENTQKRWDKNRLNLRVEYTASVLKSFLPLYDSFKKALENHDGNSSMIKGFYDQFMNILKSYKAEPIKPKTNEPFNYQLHEALSSLEKDDVPNNTIIEVVQDGWKLDKEIIRYAKVIISREPKAPEPETEKEVEEEENKLEEVETENSEEKSSVLEHDAEEKKDNSEPDYIS